MSSDWIVREDHPFDRGYWRRYDGKPRPSDKQGRKGWDQCNLELSEERSER